MEEEGFRERFYQVYPGLAEGIRDEIIAVVDGQPYTWKSAEVEVQNNTPLAKKIIIKLIEMELI